MTAEQGALFETPQQRSSREYNEALAAYMDERRVPGGYQCRDCGGTSPNSSLFWANHGLMGTHCPTAILASHKETP